MLKVLSDVSVAGCASSSNYLLWFPNSHVVCSVSLANFLTSVKRTDLQRGKVLPPKLRSDENGSKRRNRRCCGLSCHRAGLDAPVSTEERSRTYDERRSDRRRPQMTVHCHAR